MIIEAGHGLGEAIVSGQITPDSYVVSKKDLSIIDINIGEQTKKLIKYPGAAKKCANKWVNLGLIGKKQKLTGKQVVDVAKICRQIEKHYKFPCDIEWAMEGGKIYITQSRPITTLKK